MALDDEKRRKTIITSHSSSSSSSESLPSEIIFEILSRLPVESLLRCKSVCKSWCSLISNPYFIKCHLTLSTTNHHYARHNLLVHCLPRLPWVGENLITCPLYDVMYDHNPINLLELDYPMKNFYKEVSIVGSCNGLICIEIEPDILFIWNPSTRKSIQLPDTRCSARIAGFGMTRGFGYNESSDDYKVVEICSKNKVMIYSTRNWNWKDFGGFPHRICFNDTNVFFKGALHWIAITDSGSRIVVSLDLAKETYGEVLLPVDTEVDPVLKLGILGNCLCVFADCSRSSRFCADVWVMKIYGVKDSWFKLVSIPHDPAHLTTRARTHWGRLLCVLDDGKVLVLYESRVTVFDSKDGSAFEIQKFDGCYKACTFVESLVSPAGHDNLI